MSEQSRRERGRGRGTGRAVWRESGNSSVAYLVVRNGKLEYGERRCGFDKGNQRTTKAPEGGAPVLDRSDAEHAPPPRPPFGRSRGRRSQTVGADCLTVCHPRDRSNLIGRERGREGDRFLIAVLRNMPWSALYIYTYIYIHIYIYIYLHIYIFI